MPAKKEGTGKSKRYTDAMKHLKKADPLLYKTALPHWDELAKRKGHRRNYQQLFAALAGSVTGQQLSTKAADTIWGRLEVACNGSVTPEAIQSISIETMRAAGLSAAKTKTLKELSSAILEERLDLSSLRKVPEAEAVERLSAIWGIGRWTAEMFLMFALERDDVFSPGDLGLRRSIEAIYGLPKDVHIRELETIALRWSPHRSFASRVLWRFRDTP